MLLLKLRELGLECQVSALFTREERGGLGNICLQRKVR